MLDMKFLFCFDQSWMIDQSIQGDHCFASNTVAHKGHKHTGNQLHICSPRSAWSFRFCNFSSRECVRASVSSCSSSSWAAWIWDRLMRWASICSLHSPCAQKEVITTLTWNNSQGIHGMKLKERKEKLSGMDKLSIRYITFNLQHDTAIC